MYVIIILRMVEVTRMRIAICEDNKVAADDIRNMIDNYFITRKAAHVIDVYYDTDSFEKFEHAYDLVFLDYKFPEKNGMDVARHLREISDEVGIVFISAYREHVFESFEVGAFRYLLKPVKESELISTLDSFVAQRRKNLPVEVPLKNKNIYIKADEILYIESYEKHCIVRMTDKSYETSKALSTFQADINSSSFFRTHRRYLVNMKYIAEIEKNIITLINGEKVEISRRNLINFNKCYMNYLRYSI